MTLLLTLSNLSKILRYVHRNRPEVSEELRGWSWRQPPLLFPYENIRLAISETTVLYARLEETFTLSMFYT